MIRAYARVSTQDQDLAAQLESLTAAGAGVIYSEKASGAKRDRPQLDLLLNDLQPGDVLLVTKLDRLARSTLDLLTIMRAVEKAGAVFKSLSEGWADTSTHVGRLVIQVLAVIAEFERERILERTSEGRKRAQAAGVKFGRKHRFTPEQQAEIKQRTMHESARALAREYGVGKDLIRAIRNAA